VEFVLSVDYGVSGLMLMIYELDGESLRMLGEFGGQTWVLRGNVWWRDIGMTWNGRLGRL
jgi:hypothetical protein